MSDENTLAAVAAEADEARASEAETPEAGEVDGGGEKAEAPEAGKAPPAGAETEDDEGDEGEGRPKRRNRRSARERIAELTRQKREFEDRARRAEEALAKNKPPKMEDFDTDEAFEDAKAEYAYRRMTAKDARETARHTAREIEAAAVADYQASVEAFRAEAPDYDAVAHSAPISDDVVRAVVRLGDDAARVAYALGKDHARAREISALDPMSAAIELGRIAATLRRPARKIATQAPPPVRPAVEGGGSTTPDPEKMSYDAYRRWRMGS